MPALPCRFRALLALVLASLLSGCDRPYSIQFAAQVGSEPLRCGTLYEGIGTTHSTLELLDFKVYVRDVHLVRANGERHRLVLEQDERWQRDTFALLDFEDGTGSCNSASPDVRTEVVGRALEFGDYTGVEFTLGLPPDINHLNWVRNAPPLDVPGMWWSWKNGFKFLRLDVRTDGDRPYFFHLGADSCDGTAVSGFTCAARNDARLSLQGFDPKQSRIVFDVAALFAGTDFDAAAGGPVDDVAGCMSSADDPECPPLLRQVGLGDGAAAPSGPGAFIRVE